MRQPQRDWRPRAPLQAPMHFKLSNITNLAGFAAENVKPGVVGPVLARASLTSEDPEFFGYMEQITASFLVPAGVWVDKVHHFLVVMHGDATADLFVDDFPVAVEMKAKRDIKKGELITQGDIADIRRLNFPEISIGPTDKIIYVFKVGWRFGLFFDFGAAALGSKRRRSAAKHLDVDAMQLSIGALYRYLSFYSVYRLLETGTEQFEEMQGDGWFPFVETLPGDFSALTKAYDNKFDFDNKVSAVVERFDGKRIRGIVGKWWKNERFTAKRTLIEAGVNAYLQNTADGFVNCIKTISPETEGLLRSIYRADEAKGRMTQKRFLKHIADKAKAKAGSDYSLLLARPFLEYLEKHTFRNFDVDKGDVRLSRHSSGHGEASPDLYTKARALQLILVLDQIYFFD